MAVVNAQIWYPYGPTGPAYNLSDVIAISQPTTNTGGPSDVIKVEFSGGAPNLLNVVFDLSDFETAYQAYLDTL